MREHPLETARRHGVLQAILTSEAIGLYERQPALLANDCAMAATLRGRGYTSGEVDAFLCLTPARAA